MQSKVIKNIIWLAGDQVLRLFVSFFLGAWTARYLQPEQYGLLNYAVAFVSLFSPLANLNDLNQIAVRDISVEPKLKEEVLGTTFFLKLLGSLVASFLSFWLILILKSEDKTSHIIVLLISVTSGLFYTFNTIDCWFQYKVQSKYSVIAKNLTFVVTSLIRIILLSFHFPLIAFVWLMAFEYLLTSGCLMIAYYVSGQDIRKWNFKLTRARKLIKDSWALILSGIAISIYLRIDQMMLGRIVGNSEVGIYSIAVRLSDIFCFLPSAIVASMISITIESKTRSEQEFYSKLQKLFDIMVLIAFACAIFMTFISYNFINIIYGESYKASADVVTIHIWSLVFVFLGMAKNIWVVTEDQGIYALLSTLGGVVINVLLNLFLIPKYQSVGAAMATLISYSFADYITCFVYPNARNIGWMMTRSITLVSPVQLVVNNLLKRR